MNLHAARFGDHVRALRLQHFRLTTSTTWTAAHETVRHAPADTMLGADFDFVLSLDPPFEELDGTEWTFATHGLSGLDGEALVGWARASIDRDGRDYLVRMGPIDLPLADLNLRDPDPRKINRALLEAVREVNEVDIEMLPPVQRSRDLTWLGPLTDEEQATLNEEQVAGLRELQRQIDRLADQWRESPD